MSIVDDIKGDARRIPRRLVTVGLPEKLPWRTMGGAATLVGLAVLLLWWLGAID
jgi:hypothetical protein